jgi:hypothetical protein
MLIFSALADSDLSHLRAIYPTVGRSITDLTLMEIFDKLRALHGRSTRHSREVILSRLIRRADDTKSIIDISATHRDDHILLASTSAALSEHQKMEYFRGALLHRPDFATADGTFTLVHPDEELHDFELLVAHILTQLAHGQRHSLGSLGFAGSVTTASSIPPAVPVRTYLDTGSYDAGYAAAMASLAPGRAPNRVPGRRRHFCYKHDNNNTHSSVDCLWLRARPGIITPAQLAMTTKPANWVAPVAPVH